MATKNRIKKFQYTQSSTGEVFRAEGEIMPNGDLNLRYMFNTEFDNNEVMAGTLAEKCCRWCETQEGIEKDNY